MREVNNEEIARRLFYSTCTHDCLDSEIRDSILEKFENNEELHSQVCEVFSLTAERYFVEGYLFAKK